MFGHVFDVVGGRVADHDAALGGRLNVDVIVSATRRDHEAEAWEVFEHPRVTGKRYAR